MYLLEAEKISKTFSENLIKANSDVDFNLIEGETHSILGENGSGKSTLMHILTGLITPDSGRIRYKGEETELKTPEDALKRKIGMVHQSPGIIKGFTIFENIIAGCSFIKGIKTNLSEYRKQIEDVKEKYSISINIDSKPETPEQKQYTILLSLLFNGTDIIVFDEPTTSFTDVKSEEFFLILKKLKDNRKTIVFITHKIETALSISDRVTVLSKGKSRGCRNASEISSEEIFRMMIEDSGSKLPDSGSKQPAKKSRSIILSAEDLKYTNRNESRKLGVSFKLYKGEIIGFAGIRENNLGLLEDILGGFIPPDSGSISFKEENIAGLPTSVLRSKGVTYIPSDRFNRGTSITSSVENNMAITNIRKFTKGGMVSEGKLKKHFKKGADLYNIKADYGQPLWQLSGGNIQKVILFRELDSPPDLLIFCEPAWNLDIRSKKMIYDRIKELRDNGTSVIILSTDIEEIISLSDRVYVLYKGKIAGTLKGDRINSNDIGKLMLGIGDSIEK